VIQLRSKRYDLTLGLESTRHILPQESCLIFKLLPKISIFVLQKKKPEPHLSVFSTKPDQFIAKRQQFKLQARLIS
jgi:hypothetical protein